MTELLKCDRCGNTYEPWTHFRRTLPKAKVKERGDGLGVVFYREADLCKPCARDLEDFMDGGELA